MYDSDGSAKLVVRLLSNMERERNANLNGHSLYVQNLAMALWRHLPENLRETVDAVDLEDAALLHDIGKMGIPDQILNKPGRLNEDEWKLMRQHPKKGVEILRDLQCFQTILPWIEYHHERMDGKGYYGLPGNEIPLASRIIAVADTYSAVTMRRCYKPALPQDAARQILKDAAGTQLDAQLVDTFLRIPMEELLTCVPEGVDVGGKPYCPFTGRAAAV